MSARHTRRGESKAAEQRRRPRVRDRKRTHQKLLEAGLHVFSRDGYNAATIEDVAIEAGISRATFYLHFGDKREIARAILDGVADEQSGDMLSKLDALGDFTWQQARDWVSNTALWYEHNRAINSVILAILTSEPGFATSWILDDQRVAGNLTRYLVRNGQDEARARLRVLILVQALYFTWYLWKVAGAEVDEERLLDAMADIWWAVLHED